MITEFSFEGLKVKVGLEIHQQLATDRKLFCSCKPIESAKYMIEFQRKLRAPKSELGEYDPAALFEKSKSRTIIYYGNPQSSCLVEQDEEPPHEMDQHAKEITLGIAAALNSNVFAEIYPMRKTVLDGSNPSGFQRTMLVSHGGYYEAGTKKIGIQSICLEEDAARILGEQGQIRKYSLDRLGIPLVEIATEPFEARLEEIKDIALALGRILRSTKKVKRGIGSIRQDVNVSIRNGPVVEVKGVQQLDQLGKIVEYEAKRQYGLHLISEELRNTKLREPKKIDITEEARTWNSDIIANAIKKQHTVTMMIFAGMAGIFGREDIPGIRLGRDLAEVVRTFGLGGIFHSDELPSYGIVQKDIDLLREKYGINGNDAFLLLASTSHAADTITGQISLRIAEICNNRVPRDTRLATEGKTRFLRPRPGAARMYPETDIRPITISKKELQDAIENIPKTWDESIAEMQAKFDLNAQLAGQILDSRYVDLFEKIAKNVSVSPTFVASVLCSSITSLEREGLDSKLLKDGEIVKTFEFLEEQEIAKESVEIIFRDIMSGRSCTIQEAIKNTSITPIGEQDLERIIDGIVKNNVELITKQRERAAGPLMGIVMKELRGKAPGQAVSRILLKKIKEHI